MPERYTAFPDGCSLHPNATRSWDTLGIIAGESKAEDSPGMTTRSQQSHLTWRGRAWTRHRTSRKSHSQGEVWEAQLAPAPGSGGLPRAPPRPSTPPQRRPNSHTQGRGCCWGCSQGAVADHPGPPRSPGVAQVWGTLPQQEGKQPQPQAQSQPPAKSWAHHRCALGQRPAALLAEAPFLHPLHLLGTPMPILGEKTVTSISHFLQFLACGEAPGLLSGDP